MEQNHNIGRRILFVDDEQSLIETTGLLLEELGYEVRSFSQSREALGEFQQDPSAFDGVISNINMPDMNGIELAKKLMAARPDIAIMLVTGNSAVITEEQAREIGIRCMLFKPFRVGQLAAAVKRRRPGLRPAARRPWR